MLSFIRTIAVLAIAIVMTSCDIIADHAFDCINNDRPQFNLNTLPVAILNNEYRVSIKASIKNNALDSSYYYSFILLDPLPSGLRSETRWDSDEFTISGTPTEYGSFPFTLKVTAKDRYQFEDDESYDDGDSLCDNDHSQHYVLSVVIENEE